MFFGLFSGALMSRMLIGFGIALSSYVGTAYICELASPDIRSSLMMTGGVAMQLGTLSYILGTLLHWKVNYDGNFFSKLL